MTSRYVRSKDHPKDTTSTAAALGEHPQLRAVTALYETPQRSRWWAPEKGARGHHRKSKEPPTGTGQATGGADRRGVRIGRPVNCPVRGRYSQQPLPSRLDPGAA